MVDDACHVDCSRKRCARREMQIWSVYKRCVPIDLVGHWVAYSDRSAGVARKSC